MAKSLGTTFGAMSRSMKRLGFSELKRDGYVVFTHRSGRPMIMLPSYRLGEAVQPIHQMMIRKQLTDAGLIKERGFAGGFSPKPRKPPASAHKIKP